MKYFQLGLLKFCCISFLWKKRNHSRVDSLKKGLSLPNTPQKSLYPAGRQPFFFLTHLFHLAS